MSGYAYDGACGAMISEDWHGNMQIVQCNFGRGMQCDGGTDPTELCLGCPRATEDDYKDVPYHFGDGVSDE